MSRDMDILRASMSSSKPEKTRTSFIIAALIVIAGAVGGWVLGWVNDMRIANAPPPAPASQASLPVAEPEPASAPVAEPEVPSAAYRSLQVYLYRQTMDELGMCRRTIGAQTANALITNYNSRNQARMEAWLASFMTEGGRLEQPAGLPERVVTSSVRADASQCARLRTEVHTGRRNLSEPPR